MKACIISFLSFLTLVKEFIYSLRQNPNPAETTGPTPRDCPKPQWNQCWDSACPGQGCSRLLPQVHTDLLAPLSVCPNPSALGHIGCNSQSNVQLIGIQAWGSTLTACSQWGEAPAAQWAHNGQGAQEKWPLFIIYMQETMYWKCQFWLSLPDTILVCHH